LFQSTIGFQFGLFFQQIFIDADLKVSFPGSGMHFFSCGGSIRTLVVLWCVMDAGGVLYVQCDTVTPYRSSV
jgi:hypothetical protein